MRRDAGDARFVRFFPGSSKLDRASCLATARSVGRRGTTMHVNEPVIPSPPARRFRPTPALIAGGLVAGFFLAGLGVAFAQTSSSGTTPTIPVSPVPPPAGQIVPAPAPAPGPAQAPG